IEMATNFIKPRYFSGELDEDLTEWVKQFNQAAESNEWVNNDVANNQKTRMAKVHLGGAAADWCDDNNATITYWQTHGVADTRLAELIVTKFATGHRKLQWLQNFDEIRQKGGESVEEFNRRFDKVV